MNALAVNDDVVAVGSHSAGIGTVHAVTFEQHGVRFGIGEIVDCDEFKPAVGPFEDRARDEATDASEPVDCNFHSHDLNFLPIRR